MERSLLLFKESVKSKQSFETYLVRLKMFMKYHGIKSYDDVLRQSNLQELFEDWIIAKKQTKEKQSFSKSMELTRQNGLKMFGINTSMRIRYLKNTSLME